MNYNESPVSSILGSDIKITQSPNDLYPPNFRVHFIFKCF